MMLRGSVQTAMACVLTMSVSVLAQVDVELWEGTGCVTNGVACRDIGVGICCEGANNTLYASATSYDHSNPNNLYYTQLYSLQNGDKCAVEISSNFGCNSVENGIASATGASGSPGNTNKIKRDRSQCRMADVMFAILNGKRYELAINSTEYELYQSFPAGPTKNAFLVEHSLV